MESSITLDKLEGANLNHWIIDLGDVVGYTYSAGSVRAILNHWITDLGDVVGDTYSVGSVRKANLID
jgi:hypothetical protein